MGFIKEFKVFLSRGNVIDLAIGIVIGAAFGKIVTSLVNDILMPPLGMVIGGVDFKDLVIPLKKAHYNDAGIIIKEAVSIQIGHFIQTIFDFGIIAFAIFLLVKAMNRFKRKQEQEHAIEALPVETKEESLLKEIRDILKEKK